MPDTFDYLLPDQNLKSIQVSDEDIIDYPNGKKRRKVYENCQYDQLQMKQIQQFRKWAENKFNLKDVPDKTVMRYLYSYEFNNKEALQKIKVYLDWYSNPKIQRFDNVTLEIINQGVCYTYGRDKNHRPIIFLNVALIDIKKNTLDDYLSAINAIVTLTVQKLFIKGKIQSYLFVIDTQNKNFSSFPLSIVKQIVLQLSHIYSMRMGRLLLINCNYLIKFMYSAVSPFLADVTKQKIKLLSRSQIEKGNMKDFVDINELQQKYGGFRQNLVQKWPPRIPGKQFKSKKKIVRKQLSLEKGSKEMDESDYYSVENNEELFEKYGEQGMIVEGCCSTTECSIY